MRRKTVSGIMLTLLLIGMLMLAFNIQPVKAEPRTTAIQAKSLVCGVIIDPLGDVTIGDATSVNFDITKISFSFNQGNLIIEFEVSGKITQGGYFVLFDTDQDTHTGCSGYGEIDDFIGTDYFIHFDPINVPAAQLCSSYRPWVRIKGLQYDLNENVVTFYLALSDIGLSGDVIKFDVVARTFLHWNGKIYKDRAPDTGVFTIKIVRAIVDIHPQVLNSRSKGAWITAYIELPEGYNISDINRTMILLNYTISVDPFWVDKPLESVIGDHDDDGITDLMVKFSRAAVIEYLLGQNITYGKVTLTVIGELYDGTSFEGSDIIRVKMPSDVNSSCDECVDNYKLLVPEFPSFLILPLFIIATLLAVIIYRRKHSM